MYHKLCIVILSICTVKTQGWGREGHYITARIAEAFLSPPGRRLVEKLLGEESLKQGIPFYDAAAWADQVQSDPAYTWSPPLHFINTPDRLCDGFDVGRDCSSGWCLVTGIRNYTMRVADETLPVQERAEALKFLMHFLADVNQPLHVAFATDKGGNKISVKPPWDHASDKRGRLIKSPRPKPLHVLWDSHIIQYVYVTGNATWVALADQLIGEIQFGILTGIQELDYEYDAAVRAEESSMLACSHSYKDAGTWITDSDELPLNYYQTMARVSMDQLSKSGLDIAVTLNEIGDFIEATADTDADTMSVSDEDEDVDSDIEHSDSERLSEYDTVFVTP